MPETRTAIPPPLGVAREARGAAKANAVRLGGAAPPRSLTFFANDETVATVALPARPLRLPSQAFVAAQAEVRAQAAERLTFAAERRAFAVERRRWARLNSLVWLMVAVAFVMLAFKVAGA